MKYSESLHGALGHAVGRVGHVGRRAGKILFFSDATSIQVHASVNESLPRLSNWRAFFCLGYGVIRLWLPGDWSVSTAMLIAAVWCKARAVGHTIAPSL